MATASAIGRMLAEAQGRLTTAMARLSEALGVPPLAVLEVRYRDPAYQEAARWTALAEWAEALAERVGRADDQAVGRLAEVLTDELNRKTKAELQQWAAEQGLTLDGDLRKDEMVTTLLAQLRGVAEQAEG